MVLLSILCVLVVLVFLLILCRIVLAYTGYIVCMCVVLLHLTASLMISKFTEIYGCKYLPPEFSLEVASEWFHMTLSLFFQLLQFHAYMYMYNLHPHFHPGFPHVIYMNYPLHPYSFLLHSQNSSLEYLFCMFTVKRFFFCQLSWEIWIHMHGSLYFHFY